MDDTSCNLASINIYKVYEDSSDHDDFYQNFEHLVALCQLVLEASIHWGQFPTKDVARRTHLFRTTGLGLANLSSLLLVKGYAYDSDEARLLAADLMSFLTGTSYIVSALMAKKVGAFEKFEINKPYMMNVVAKHLSASKKHDNFTHIWETAMSLGNEYGYRNAQVSVIAPTGTISFAMDCAATSTEPFFSHIVYKKLVGGGSMIIANPLISKALESLNYDPHEISAIIKYIEDNNGNFENAPYLKEKDYPVFDTANKNGNGTRYISPMGHIKMLAALQPFVSGSISKTVNLPKEATKEDISEVYIKAWEYGVKCVSVYRDGSKASQPLNTSLSDDNKTENLEELSYQDLLKVAKEKVEEVNTLKNQPVISCERKKLDGVRIGRTHPATIDGIKIYTTINRNEHGEISEIYITTSKVGSTITGLLNTISKTISTMLQYHVKPSDISKMLRGQQFEPSGFVFGHPNIKNVSSIADLVSKIIDIELGDYSRCQVKDIKLNNINVKEELVGEVTPIEVKQEIKHEEMGEKVYGKTCSVCGSSRMRQNGTCMVCEDCGSTTGCS